MQAKTPRKQRHNRYHGENPHPFDSIFDAVYGELGQYPDREGLKRQVAERVALYAMSGLPDEQRIRLAVLNSFGRAG
jgi:elongation factor P hydroxylase